MLRSVFASVMVLFLSLPLIAACDPVVEDQVLSTSCTVYLNDDNMKGGSATIFGTSDGQYAITAGHVVMGEWASKELEVFVCGQKVKVKSEGFKPVWLFQQKFCNGKESASIRVKAEIVAYSPPEELGGVDVAVLKLEQNDQLKANAKWDRNAKLERGDDVLHVGTLYADIDGALCKGSVLRTDHFVKGQGWGARFDCVHIGAARNGSSGGGVFKKVGCNYVWVGMVVRGDGAGMMLVHNKQHVEKFLVSVGFGEICGAECKCGDGCKCGVNCKCKANGKCNPNCKCGDRPPKAERPAEGCCDCCRPDLPPQ